MSTSSLIAQVSLLTTILMLPQYAKLNIKRRKPEGKEVEEKKQEMEEALEKKLPLLLFMVVNIQSRALLAGYSGIPVTQRMI